MEIESRWKRLYDIMLIKTSVPKRHVIKYWMERVTS